MAGSRRWARWVTLLLASLAPACAPSGASVSSAGSVPPVPPPARVLLVGDSLMQEVAAAAEAGTDTQVDYVLTIGTADVDEGWWDLWPRVIREVQPDVVAVLVGAWEIARDDLGTPGWRRWYGDRLDRWADQLTAGGAQLLWVQPPAVRDPVNEPRFAQVRAAYEALAARRADTVAVDGLPGPYRTFAGTHRLRRTDGLHLCPAGAAVMAAHVLGAAGLPAPPGGWLQGDWTRRAPAYDRVECPPST